MAADTSGALGPAVAWQGDSRRRTLAMAQPPACRHSVQGSLGLLLAGLARRGLEQPRSICCWRCDGAEPSLEPLRPHPCSQGLGPRALGAGGGFPGLPIPGAVLLAPGVAGGVGHPPPLACCLLSRPPFPNPGGWGKLRL